MNWINNLVNWGKDAWNWLAGLPSDVSTAIQKVWHFIASLHGLLGWLVRTPLWEVIAAYLDYCRWVITAFERLNGALDRVSDWIYAWFIAPFRSQVRRWFAQLRAWINRTFAATYRFIWARYYASRAYTRQQVGAERQARVKDVKAARAYALKLVTAALALVQKEAASGYDTGLDARLGTIKRLLDDLGARNPIVRGLVSRLITGVLDLGSIEDPAARLLLTFIARQIIDRLGVDQVAGDLMGRLLGTVAGKPKPSNLHDVIVDLDQRVTALEAQWADFMTDGGPEVEQAGRQWKDITSLAADGALLGVFGLAVADPAAWAAGVSGTLGQAVNDGMIGIVDLIRKA